MKILIGYYSRSGKTAVVAAKLAELLASGSDSEEGSKRVEVTLEKIIEQKDRSGIRGCISATWDALFSVRIGATVVNRAEDFDLLIVGTPVWACSAVPVVLDWTRTQRKGTRRAAFFCTMGSCGDRGTFENLSGATGDTPVATVAINAKQLKNDDQLNEKLGSFVEKLLG